MIHLAARVGGIGANRAHPAEFFYDNPSTLLGTRPMPWDLLAVGTVTAIAIAVAGAFYFRRMERIFADVA